MYLELKHIRKHYGAKVALADVSFKVKSGQIVGLFGPNGSGKTTLFSIIIGDQKPDSGQILFDGKDISNLPVYARVRLGMSYLPQESSIFRDLSVEDNVLSVLELYERDPNKRFEKLEYLLSKMDVLGLKTRKASTLSGGERRRVEIARILAIDPKFVLLDEPLAAIDPITVQEIKLLIKQLKDLDIGIIVTDHNVKDTLDVVDYAHILFRHEIIASGTPQEIIKDKNARHYYFGEGFI